MKLINSLSLVIKFSRTIRSPSFSGILCVLFMKQLFWFYFRFYVFIRPCRIFIIASDIRIRYVVSDNIWYGFIKHSYLGVDILMAQKFAPIYQVNGFSNIEYTSLFGIPYQTLIWWGQVIWKLKLARTVLRWQFGCKDARTP